MVLGRRRFTWRDDVRGVATVLLLALAIVTLSVAVLAVVLLAAGGAR